MSVNSMKTMSVDVKSAAFGKQDCQLIKEMIEVGITSVATHICITCSLDRSSSFWTSVAPKTHDRE